jgi:hypothetical protein
MRTVAFCECDPYCQAVLRKHWPDVPIYDDVRTLTAAQILADTTSARTNGHTRRKVSSHAMLGEPSIDVICGGFPCQDISVAGKRAGLAGARSGLWSEFARIIGEIRPRHVIVENVPPFAVEGCPEFSGTWPRSGIMLNGTAYQLPLLARSTDAIGFGSWVGTPTSRDYKDGSAKSCQNVPVKSRLGRAVHTLQPHPSDQAGGSLNPTWVEWLMGFPIGFTDLGPLETQSFRKLRKSSASQSCFPTQLAK